MCVVNVGHREHGYKTSHILGKETRHQLQHYIDVISKKYQGILVEKNVELAKEMLSTGKFNFDKWKPIINGALCFGVALLIQDVSVVEASAPQGINLAPIDNLMNEVYWAMLKIALYIMTPVYSWVGYTLIFAGANVGRRTTAKTIAIWSTLGLGVIAAAPWAAKAFYEVWTRIF